MLLKLNERENMVASLELSDAQFNAQLIAVAVGFITIVSVYFLFLAPSSKLPQSPLQTSKNINRDGLENRDQTSVGSD
jgi:hypothetical protein